MTVKLANNAVGYLNSAITAADVELILQSGQGVNFPSLSGAQYFYATLASSNGYSEVVKVTGRTDDTLAITRAQDGTSAKTFAAGSRVEMRVNAAAIEDYVDVAVTEAIDAVTAADIEIVDSGVYFAAANVEAALQEIGAWDKDYYGPIFHPRTTAELSAAITPTDYRYPPGNVLRYGAVGDGSTDDSTALQDAIDANKGGTVILPAGYSFLAEGILLDGSDYDGTHIQIDGEFKLKPAPARTTNNDSNGWTGIVFRSCDGCSIEGTFNGDRTNQQDREQTHCLVLAGVTNFSAGVLRFREIRGDGVYITQSVVSALGDNSNGVRIGSIFGWNSADDGRNLVSVISCDNLSIGLLDAYQIGGIVYGGQMPGGFDIEPNYAYQSCKHISVGVVNYYGASSVGCAIHGREDDLSVTSGVSIGVVNSIKTNAAALTDGLGATTIGASSHLKIDHCRNVTIGTLNGKSLNSYSYRGFVLSNCERVKIGAGLVQHVAWGAAIGRETEDNTYDGVKNIDINVDVDDTCRYGYELGKVTDALIRGRITNPVTGNYTARMAVQGILYALTRVTFSNSIPYHADWTRAYRDDATNPGTYTNCKILNADFGGTSWASFNTMSDMGIPVYNSYGYTEGRSTSVPTTGVHVVGQRIYNADPAAGEPLGWICTAAGTPGTWVPFGGIQSANAYTVTNGGTDRAYDANATTVEELADVLGTLITDLRSAGIIQ